jgi:hypothetical protein
MTMTAVVAENHILWPKVLGQRNSCHFLSNAGMNRTEQASLAEKLQKALFKQADSQRLLNQSEVRQRAIC